jgi:hypothetical protein
MKKPQIKSPSCKGLFNCLSFDDSFQKFRRSGFSYNLAEEYAAQNDEEIPLYSASLISLGNRKGFFKHLFAEEAPGLCQHATLIALGLESMIDAVLSLGSTCKYFFVFILVCLNEPLI